VAPEVAYYTSIGEIWNPPELSAYDANGKNVDVILYDGEYDTTESSTHRLIYKAEDDYGNITKISIWLYVYSNEPAPENYPEMAENNLTTIYERWETERHNLNVKYPLDEFNFYEYYQTLEDLEGEAFFIQLKNIISAVQQVTYDEARFILELSDTKHSVYGPYLHGIYDSKKLVRYWDNAVDGVSATIDREHVWPQSYLTLKASDKTRSMATDIHNLRAIFKSTNGSRQNHYFVSGSGDNGNQGDGTYYPGDDHRGDVARILFYMHVRYSEDLFLTNNAMDILNYKVDETKIDGKIPFGLLDVLLEWHYADPVDDFERHRNDIIYMYQGNRNPFIDHPEYVDIIFEVETSSGESVMITVMLVDYDLNLNDLRRKDKIESYN
jgi:endonuclease I